MPREAPARPCRSGVAPRPDFEAVRTLERALTERLRAAEEAGWRVESFLESPAAPERGRA